MNILVHFAKIRIRIFLRCFLAETKKRSIGTLVVYFFGTVFLVRILIGLYNSNQRIFHLISHDDKTRLVALQASIFLILFILITLLFVFRSYKYIDRCLSVFPVPERVVFLFSLLRTCLPVLLLDTVFFGFTIRGIFVFAIVGTIALQFLFILVCYDLVFRILSQRKIYKYLIIILLIILISGILLSAWQKSKVFFFIESVFSKVLSVIIISGRAAGVDAYMYWIIISLAALFLSYFLYEKVKNRFNPLMISILQESMKNLESTEKVMKRNECDIGSTYFQTKGSRFISFMVKDKRVLFREVGLRIISVGLITSILLLFGVDLINGGRLMLGTITTMGTLGYISILISWIVALPSVGSEKEGIGFLRNIVDLKILLWAKASLCFFVTAIIGFLDLGFIMILMKRKGLHIPNIGLLAAINVFQYSLLFSLFGTLIGAFFARFKNSSGERLKNVSLPGWILYFAVGIALNFMIILVDLLYFVEFVYLILGMIVVSILFVTVALALARSAEKNLYKQEL